MKVKNIEIGRVYRIRHKRKGEFVAQVIDIEKREDAIDPFIIVVKYDVRYGTDQNRLQRTDLKDAKTGRPLGVRVSGLRPSLITLIEKTEEQKWLRDVEVPEEVKEKKMGLFGRLLKKL